MTKSKSSWAVKNMTAIALSAAVICVTAPWTVPVGPVPITLATFSVYLTSSVLGMKKGVAAVAVYLLLGFAGLPVFTYFSGGLQRLVGSTGGYLVGYLPLALICGFFVYKFKKAWAFPVGMIAGTVVLYAFGTAWYCILTSTKILPAMAACVFPFLPGDGIKIAAASAIGIKLRNAADKLLK